MDYQKDFEFLKEINKIKDIKRQITNLDGTRENDAEHMFMMSIMMLALNDYIPKEIDRLELLKTILIHDLPEIYAGDTWYLADKTNKKEKELEAAKILFKDHPEFFDIWIRYENREGNVPSTAKKLDIIQAVFSIVLNGGIEWQRNKITQEIEMGFSEYIHTEDDPLGNFLKYIFEIAIEKDLFYKKEGSNIGD